MLLLSCLFLSGYLYTALAESSNGDCPAKEYPYSQNLCGADQVQRLNVEYNFKDGKITTCDGSKNLGIFTNEAPSRVYFQGAKKVCYGSY